jgi:NifU-like protein
MKQEFGCLADHIEDPQFRGRIDDFTCQGQAGSNGQWGIVRVYLRVIHGVIDGVGYEAAGCAYTVACGSMILAWALGRTVEECRALTPKQVTDAAFGLPPNKQHCPLLVLEAFQLAIASATGSMDKQR